MFSYARRCLTSRPALWWAALVCAAILVLPGALVATLFIEPVTMLLLTGDLGLATTVAPGAVTDNGWALAGSIGVALLLTLLYNRVYAVLLWESDEERISGWKTSWRATKRIWWKVLGLNALFLLALAAAAGVLAVLTALLLSASTAAATLTTLIGVTLVVALRTIGRILVTLAARSAILDGTPFRASWTASRTMLKERRRYVVAAWASLLAVGVVVWIGGRIVTPILQDTALDFPAYSAYTYAREATQLAVAIPLEAFLLVLSAAVWTAVHRGIEAEEPLESRRPWAPKGLASLVVLAIIGNGVPAFLDVSWRNREDDQRRAVRAREITPEEAVAGAAGSGTNASSLRTQYDVTADLDGDDLRWTTTIRYENPFPTPVETLPIYVHPAAFEAEVEDIPLAREVLSTTLRERVKPGAFSVAAVRAEGTALDWERADTLLSAELESPLEQGEAIAVSVSLEAQLPTWPLRYGVWDHVVQLGNWVPTVPVQTQDGFEIRAYGDIGDPFFTPSADYAVRLRADGDIGVVGTGLLESVREGPEGRRTWTFTAPGVRDFALAAGSTLRGLEQTVAGTTVRAWYNGEDSLIGREVLDDAASAWGTFSRSYGSGGRREVDVVSIESPLGGMEYPGLVFVSAGYSQLEGLPFLPDLVRHTDFERQQRRYVTGHELAHQWWYAQVGNDQVTEPWLDEGFAEAATRLWLLEEDGDERSATIARLEGEPRLERGVIGKGVSAFEDNGEYSDAIYDVGGAVLLELRRSAGPGTYIELMRRWVREKREGIGTIPEFVALVEEVAGPDARHLLEGYLEAPTKQ